MPRWIELDGVVNMRDVGGLPTRDGRETLPGRLIRSDNLQDLSEGDVRHLVEELGVTDVVDLRSHVEHEVTGAGPLRSTPLTHHHHSLLREDLDAGETVEEALKADLAMELEAVAQLKAWGERNGVAVVAQGQDADPAAVAFDALQAAKSRGTGVLIADTAGRLHTQQGLMAELGKIRRVLAKIDTTAPHEVLMVIDGTTGQNALSQLRQFNAAVQVTGLVVTKLDGTAKGGVVFALAREFGIPIRFAGIGERPEDLRVFDAEAFVDAMLPETLGA